MNKYMYNKFKKYYFKDKDPDSISDDFVDVIVSSNEVLTKYFQEGKGRLQIAKEMSSHKNVVGSAMSSNIEKISILYDIFVKTNQDINLVKSLLNVKFLDKYAEDVVALHNKGINNALMYIRFTKLYFPKLLGKLGKLSKNYFNFVDEMLSRKPILKQYFKEEKSLSLIAESLGIKEASVMDKIYFERHYIKKCHENYLIAISEMKKRKNIENVKK